MITFRDIPGRGRGVVATKPISKGIVVELCPVLVVEHDVLPDHLFTWEGDWAGNDWDQWRGTHAVALGLGSLYNHSYEPNARYDRDFAARTIKVTAIKDILQDEEFTINYNGDWPDSRNPVWFKLHGPIV